MIVIADTTPLNYLVLIQQADLSPSEKPAWRRTLVGMVTEPVIFALSGR